MSEDAFEDSRWYEAGRICERRERAELDAAVEELCEECVTWATTNNMYTLATRVRELMKKAGK